MSGGDSNQCVGVTHGVEGTLMCGTLLIMEGTFTNCGSSLMKWRGYFTCGSYSCAWLGTFMCLELLLVHVSGDIPNAMWELLRMCGGDIPSACGIITACIRRMEEGTVFTCASVYSHPCGGVHSHVGVTHMGVPALDMVTCGSYSSCGGSHSCVGVTLPCAGTLAYQSEILHDLDISLLGCRHSFE